jgi:hypothetical protein
VVLLDSPISPSGSVERLLRTLPFLPAQPHGRQAGLAHAPHISGVVEIALLPVHAGLGPALEHIHPLMGPGAVAGHGACLHPLQDRLGVLARVVV